MGYAPSFIEHNNAPVNQASGSTVVAMHGRKRRGQKNVQNSGVETVGSTPSKLFADAKMCEGGWAASNPSEGTNAEGSSGVMVYKWNGLHWEHKGGDAGQALASDWLDDHIPDKADAPNAVKLWNWLSLRLRSKCKLPKFDQKGVAIVPCADAYLEISQSGIRVIAPDPALGMTYATKISCGTPHGSSHNPVPFDPSSRFGRWLCHALPDPSVRSMVQEQCGVCLLPGVYSQAAWWWGVAGSGKSTLAGMVESVLSSVAGVRLETLGERFGLEPIVGAQLVKVEEVEVGVKWDEGKFKPLVSGDGIYVDRKNEKAIGSYQSKAKWIITSNPEPFVRDKSNGVLRRLGIVQWANEIEGEHDPEFANKVLANEGRQFLDWMLVGALRVIQRGRMMSEEEMPGAAREQKENVRCNSDSVRAWVMEESVSHFEGKWRPTAEIYQRYVAWAERNLKDPVLCTVLIRSLNQIREVKLGKRSNRRLKVGGSAWHYELAWSNPKTDDDPRNLVDTHPNPVHFDCGDYGNLFKGDAA